MTDLRERSRAVTAEILHLMGMTARVQADDESGEIRVKIDAGDDSEALIGSRGFGIQSLHYVVSRIINKSPSESNRVHVVMDVAGYSDRHNAELLDRAREMAEIVRTSGKEQITEPLTSPDRKAIHQALSGNDDLVTYSLGVGSTKRLVVALATAERLEDHGASSDRPHRGRPSGTGEGRSAGRRRPERAGDRGHARGRIPADVGRSDGRVRDLINATPTSSTSDDPPRKKSSFRIVHMPPGMTEPQDK